MDYDLMDVDSFLESQYEYAVTGYANEDALYGYDDEDGSLDDSEFDGIDFEDY